MARRFATVLVAILSVMISALAVSPAQADVVPPWCGDPVPDAAENLPDGTDPSDPPGSFLHIPYYAIRCTLEDIVASSQGRMTLEVIGQSALGRDMFLVTVNALDTVQQRTDFQAWQQVRKVALTDPARGQALLESYGDDVKVPLYIQGAIHGNEYEGSRRSSKPRQARHDAVRGGPRGRRRPRPHGPAVQRDPEPGRQGRRYPRQRQRLRPQPRLHDGRNRRPASVSVMQKWLPPEGTRSARLRDADAHRGDDEAAQPEHRLRPVAQVEPAAHRRQRGRPGGAQLRRHQADQRLVLRRHPAPPAGFARTGSHPDRPLPRVGTTGARSTRRCTHSTSASTARRSRCATRPTTTAPLPARPRSPGPAGIADRPGDRGVVEPALRPREPERAAVRRARALPPRRDERAASAVLRAAVRRRQQLDGGVPHRVHRPDGRRPAQRARGEPAGRLAAVQRHPGRRAQAGLHLRRCDLPGRLVRRLHGPGPPGGSPTRRWASAPTSRGHQHPLRATGGMGATATSGVPTWSGFRRRRRSRRGPTDPRGHLLGGVEPGTATGYALEIDSPTAVRALNALDGRGAHRRSGAGAVRLRGGATLPTGSAIFAADAATKVRLASIGRANDVWFQPVGTSAPPTEPIDRKPSHPGAHRCPQPGRVVAAEPRLHAAFMSTAQLNAQPRTPAELRRHLEHRQLPRSGPTTARARLQAFFAAGGGYIGAGLNGANFLTNGSLVSGLRRRRS